jgi:hypothetical protein
MSEQTVSNRVLAALKEPLRHLGPLGGLFVGCQESAPVGFRRSTDDLMRAIELEILPLSDATGVNRKQSILRQIDIARQIAEAAAQDMKHFSHRGTPLSEDQLAAIHLYSQETDAERNVDSVYSLLNAALRSEDRSKVKSIKNIIWLFITALRLCPKPDCKVLHRGVRADLSAQYENNRIITWHQISSCTSLVEVLENPLFLGKSGERTIISVELNSDTMSRDISTYSSMHDEKEVILPPSTRLQVL